MQLYTHFSDLSVPARPESSVSWTAEEVERKFTGVGMGRETLSSACDRIGIELDHAVARLAEHEIVIEEGEKLKDAAARYGIEMVQILTYILVDE